MAFSKDIKQAIDNYVSGHLADLSWHQEAFDFITDSTLRLRLADEFMSTRYLYKVLEGLSAEEWLLRAQIRLQVLSYASIYEAVLHHILFDRLPSNPYVKSLTDYTTKKEISIPAHKRKALKDALSHNGREIIPTYNDVAKTDITKVRFDKKAECAASLGLIENSLKKDIIEFYEARNAIHIHAEIKKDLVYQLELSKKAYFRMEPFIEQIKNNLPLILTNNP
ncbi:hypothetical protein [Pantoea agglomerans]|uniref:hypothetical protein n=1 Tax=Enterobacter agglomerans TaxID=549 RepID=UPI003C7CF5B2